MPPPHDSKILYYLNDRDEGRYYFCRILAPPPPNAPSLTLQYLTILMIERGGCHYLLSDFGAPPTPQTSQYLTILLTERGGAAGITFYRILAPPSPDATILNYRNDREGGAIILCRVLAPLPQTPQYLTILMTGRRGGANIL